MSMQAKHTTEDASIIPLPRGYALEDWPDHRTFMRLLLISDDEKTVQKIQSARGKLQIERLSADSPLDCFLDYYDAVLCDPDLLPRFELFSCPVFLLSSREPVDLWQRGLRDGADGILFKDFPGAAIMAQVIALVNCCRKRGFEYIPIIGMEIDFEQLRISVHGTDMDLTPSEFRLIRELARNYLRAVHRKALEKALIAPTNRRSLDVHVCSVRKKLRPFQLEIESVRSKGYRLIKGSKSFSE